jgi:Arc/MetJ-type ribon-helix-helix transcriptional regulator
MSILSPQVEKLIQEAVAQGGFASPDDLVRAGIALLQQNPLHGDFVPGEMDDLLQEGERSGPSLDGDEVLAELRAMREAARRNPG